MGGGRDQLNRGRAGGESEHCCDGSGGVVRSSWELAQGAAGHVGGLYGAAATLHLGAIHIRRKGKGRREGVEKPAQSRMDAVDREGRASSLERTAERGTAPIQAERSSSNARVAHVDGCKVPGRHAPTAGSLTTTTLTGAAAAAAAVAAVAAVAGDVPRRAAALPPS
jgi:hypothetical protein